MSDIVPITKVRSKFIHEDTWVGLNTDTFIRHNNESGQVLSFSIESYDGDFTLQGSLDGVNWSDVESLLFGDFVQVQTFALYWKIIPVSVGPIKARLITKYKPNLRRFRKSLAVAARFVTFGLYVDATYVDANYILGE